MLLIQLTYLSTVVGQETASGIDVGVIGNFVGWVNDIDMTSTNNKFYHLNQYYLRALEMNLKLDKTMLIIFNGIMDQVAM